MAIFQFLNPLKQMSYDGKSGYGGGGGGGGGGGYYDGKGNYIFTSEVEPTPQPQVQPVVPQPVAPSAPRPSQSYNNRYNNYEDFENYQYDPEQQAYTPVIEFSPVPAPAPAPVAIQNQPTNLTASLVVEDYGLSTTPSQPLTSTHAAALSEPELEDYVFSAPVSQTVATTQVAASIEPTFVDDYSRPNSGEMNHNPYEPDIQYTQTAPSSSQAPGQRPLIGTSMVVKVPTDAELIQQLTVEEVSYYDSKSLTPVIVTPGYTPDAAAIESARQKSILKQQEDFALSLSQHYGLTNDDRDSLVRIMMSDTALTAAKAEEFIRDNPTQYSHYFERYDGALAIAKLIGLPDEMRGLVEVAMIARQDLDFVGMTNFIDRHPTDWPDQLILLLKKADSVAAFDQNSDLVADRNNSTAPVIYGSGIAGLTAKQVEWKYEKTFDEYKATVNRNDQSLWVMKSVVVGTKEEYQSYDNKGGAWVEVPVYGNRLSPPDDVDLLSHYVNFFGNPLEKMLGRTFDSYWQNNDQYDGKGATISVPPTLQFISRQRIGVDRDNRYRDIQHHDFHTKVEAFHQNGTFNGVSWRNLDASLVPFLSGPHYIARQLLDISKKAGFSYNVPSGDKLIDLSIYLDSIGIKDATQIYVENGRYVDRSTGRDLGEYVAGNAFCYTALGDGWTDFVPQVLPSGQVIFIPKWEDNSDLGTIITIVAIALAFTGAGAAIGAGLLSSVGVAVGAAGSISAIAATALGGAIISTGLTAMAGGDVSLKSFGKSFAMGMIGGGVSSFISGLGGVAGIAGIENLGTVGNAVNTAVTAGLSNGVTSLIMGDSFTDGFVSGVVSSAASQAGMAIASGVNTGLGLNISTAGVAAAGNFIGNYAVTGDIGQAAVSAAGAYASGVVSTQTFDDGSKIETLGDGTIRAIDTAGQVYVPGSNLNLPQNYAPPQVTVFDDGSVLTVASNGTVTSVDTSGQNYVAGSNPNLPQNQPVQPVQTTPQNLDPNRAVKVTDDGTGKKVVEFANGRTATMETTPEGEKLVAGSYVDQKGHVHSVNDGVAMITDPSQNDKLLYFKNGEVEFRVTGTDNATVLKVGEQVYLRNEAGTLLQTADNASGVVLTYNEAGTVVHATTINGKLMTDAQREMAHQAAMASGVKGSVEINREIDDEGNLTISYSDGRRASFMGKDFVHGSMLDKNGLEYSLAGSAIIVKDLSLTGNQIVRVEVDGKTTYQALEGGRAMFNTNGSIEIREADGTLIQRIDESTKIQYTFSKTGQLVDARRTDGATMSLADREAAFKVARETNAVAYQINGGPKEGGTVVAALTRTESIEKQFGKDALNDYRKMGDSQKNYEAFIAAKQSQPAIPNIPFDENAFLANQTAGSAGTSIGFGAAGSTPAAATNLNLGGFVNGSFGISMNANGQFAPQAISVVNTSIAPISSSVLDPRTSFAGSAISGMTFEQFASLQADMKVTGQTIQQLGLYDDGVRTNNAAVGALATAATTLGSFVQGVARFAEHWGDRAELAVPLSGLSEHQIKNENQLQVLFNIADSMNRYGQSLGYAASTNLSDLKSGNPLTLLQFIGERLVTSAPQMALAMVNPQSLFVSTSNSTLNTRLELQGISLDQAQWNDYTIAAGTAFVSTYLERMALSKNLSPAEYGTSMVGSLFNAGKRETGTEVVQTLLEIVGEQQGTGVNLLTVDNGARVLEAAIVGFGSGPAINGGATAINRFTNAITGGDLTSSVQASIFQGGIDFAPTTFASGFMQAPNVTVATLDPATQGFSVSNSAMNNRIEPVFDFPDVQPAMTPFTNNISVRVPNAMTSPNFSITPVAPENVMTPNFGVRPIENFYGQSQTMFSGNPVVNQNFGTAFPFAPMTPNFQQPVVSPSVSNTDAVLQPEVIVAPPSSTGFVRGARFENPEVPSVNPTPEVVDQVLQPPAPSQSSTNPDRAFNTEQFENSLGLNSFLAEADVAGHFSAVQSIVVKMNNPDYISRLKADPSLINTAIRDMQEFVYQSAMIVEKGNLTPGQVTVFREQVADVIEDFAKVAMTGDTLAIFNNWANRFSEGSINPQIVGLQDATTGHSTILSHAPKFEQLPSTAFNEVVSASQLMNHINFRMLNGVQPKNADASLAALVAFGRSVDSAAVLLDPVKAKEFRTDAEDVMNAFIHQHFTQDRQPELLEFSEQIYNGQLAENFSFSVPRTVDLDSSYQFINERRGLNFGERVEDEGVAVEILRTQIDQIANSAKNFTQFNADSVRYLISQFANTSPDGREFLNEAVDDAISSMLQKVKDAGFEVKWIPKELESVGMFKTALGLFESGAKTLWLRQGMSESMLFSVVTHEYGHFKASMSNTVMNSRSILVVPDDVDAAKAVLGTNRPGATYLHDGAYFDEVPRHVESVATQFQNWRRELANGNINQATIQPLMQSIDSVIDRQVDLLKMNSDAILQAENFVATNPHLLKGLTFIDPTSGVTYLAIPVSYTIDGHTIAARMRINIPSETILANDMKKAAEETLVAAKNDLSDLATTIQSQIQNRNDLRESTLILARSIHSNIISAPPVTSHTLDFSGISHVTGDLSSQFNLTTGERVNGITGTTDPTTADELGLSFDPEDNDLWNFKIPEANSTVVIPKIESPRSPEGTVTPEYTLFEKNIALLTVSDSHVVDVRPIDGRYGSALLFTFDNGAKGVWKPVRYMNGGAYSAPEHAAYHVSQLIGENFVPAVTYRMYENGEVGTIQRFVESDTDLLASQGLELIDNPIRTAFFDALIGNPDRNGGNYLSIDGRIALIDHSAAFSSYDTGFDQFRESLSAAFKDYLKFDLENFESGGDKAALERLQMLLPSQSVFDRLVGVTDAEWQSTFAGNLTKNEIDAFIANKNRLIVEIRGIQREFGAQILAESQNYKAETRPIPNVDFPVNGGGLNSDVNPENPMTLQPIDADPIPVGTTEEGTDDDFAQFLELQGLSNSAGGDPSVSMNMNVRSQEGLTEADYRSSLNVLAYNNPIANPFSHSSFNGTGYVSGGGIRASSEAMNDAAEALRNKDYDSVERNAAGARTELVNLRLAIDLSQDWESSRFQAQQTPSDQVRVFSDGVASIRIVDADHGSRVTILINSSENKLGHKIEFNMSEVDPSLQIVIDSFKAESLGLIPVVNKVISDADALLSLVRVERAIAATPVQMAEQRIINDFQSSVQYLDGRFQVGTAEGQGLAWFDANGNPTVRVNALAGDVQLDSDDLQIIGWTPQATAVARHEVAHVQDVQEAANARGQSPNLMAFRDSSGEPFFRSEINSTVTTLRAQLNGFIDALVLQDKTTASRIYAEAPAVLAELESYIATIGHADRFVLSQPGLALMQSSLMLDSTSRAVNPGFVRYKYDIVDSSGVRSSLSAEVPAGSPENSVIALIKLQHELGLREVNAIASALEDGVDSTGKTVLGLRRQVQDLIVTADARGLDPIHTDYSIKFKSDAEVSGGIVMHMNVQSGSPSGGSAQTDFLSLLLKGDVRSAESREPQVEVAPTAPPTTQELLSAAEERYQTISSNRSSNPVDRLIARLERDALTQQLIDSNVESNRDDFLALLNKDFRPSNEGITVQSNAVAQPTLTVEEAQQLAARARRMVQNGETSSIDILLTKMRRERTVEDIVNELARQALGPSPTEIERIRALKSELDKANDLQILVDPRLQALDKELYAIERRYRPFNAQERQIFEAVVEIPRDTVKLTKVEERYIEDIRKAVYGANIKPQLFPEDVQVIAGVNNLLQQIAVNRANAISEAKNALREINQSSEPQATAVPSEFEKAFKAKFSMSQRTYHDGYSGKSVDLLEVLVKLVKMRPEDAVSHAYYRPVQDFYYTSIVTSSGALRSSVAGDPGIEFFHLRMQQLSRIAEIRELNVNHDIPKPI